MGYLDMPILDICTEVVFHDFSAPKMWNIFTPGVILLNGLNSIGHRCFFQALFSCLQKQRRQSANGSDGKLPNTYLYVLCVEGPYRLGRTSTFPSASKMEKRIISEICGTKFPLPDDPSDSDFHRSMEAAECHICHVAAMV
jgi:hypothetical protein